MLALASDLMRSSQQKFLLLSRHGGLASETALFLRSATQNSRRMNAPGTPRLCGGLRRCPRASRCPSCTWRRSTLGTLRSGGHDRTPADAACRKSHNCPAAARALGEALMLSPELRARKSCTNCAATLCRPVSSRPWRRIRCAPSTGRICPGTCATRRSSSWLVRLRRGTRATRFSRPPLHFSRFPNAYSTSMSSPHGPRPNPTIRWVSVNILWRVCARRIGP